MEDKEQSLIEHLSQLRQKLWRAALGLFVATLICFAVSDEILAVLRSPMEAVLGANAHFVVLAPQEYFFTRMQAAMVAGIFLSTPWWLFQLWLFLFQPFEGSYEPGGAVLGSLPDDAGIDQNKICLFDIRCRQ